MSCTSQQRGSETAARQGLKQAKRTAVLGCASQLLVHLLHRQLDGCGGKWCQYEYDFRVKDSVEYGDISVEVFSLGSMGKGCWRKARGNAPQQVNVSGWSRLLLLSPPDTGQLCPVDTTDFAR